MIQYSIDNAFLNRIRRGRILNSLQLKRRLDSAIDYCFNYPSNYETIINAQKSDVTGNLQIQIQSEFGSQLAQFGLKNLQITFYYEKCTEITCSKCSTSSTCLICKPEYPYFDRATQKCFQTCLDGYEKIENPGRSQCLKCDPTYQLGEKSGKNYQGINGKCACDPFSEYEVVKEGISTCKSRGYKCQAPCLKCFEDTNYCLKCNLKDENLVDLNIQPLNGECVCPKYQVFSKTNGLCMNCNSNCFQCDENDVNQCTLCRERDFFDPTPKNGKCECLNNFKFNNSSNTCICEFGFVFWQNKCLSCNEECKSCETSPEKCTVCNEQQGFFNAQNDTITCLQKINPSDCKGDPKKIKIKNICYCQSGYIMDLKTENCIQKSDQSKTPSDAQISTMKSTSNAFAGAVAAGGFLSVVSGNPATFLRIVDVLQELQLILYIDIEYTQTVVVFFQSLKMFDFKILPSILNQVDLYENRMWAPEVFMKNGLDSNFLANTNQFIFGLVSLLGTYFFFKIVVLALLKFKVSQTRIICQIFFYIQKGYEYQAFIAYGVSGYLNISLAIFLQLKNASCNSVNTIISYAFASFSLLGMFLFTNFIGTISRKKVKNEFDDEQGFQERFGIVFQSFKENGKFSQVGFYQKIILKKLFFSIILVFWYDQPLTVLFSLVLLNSFYIFSLIRYLPYQDNYYNVKDLTVTLLFTGALGVACSIANSSSQINLDIREKQGWAIIWLIVCVILIEVLTILRENYYALQELINLILQKYKEYKEKKQVQNDRKVSSDSSQHILANNSQVGSRIQREEGRNENILNF